MNCFFKSLFLQPGKVLGMSLLPFSAFQASQLALMDSPFLLGGSPGWGDIVTALLVCKSKRSDGLKKVLRFQNNRAYRAYWWCRLFVRNTDKICVKINDHISSYFDYPEVENVIGEHTKNAGAPWWYFMVSLMWQETAASLDELWDMPLGELSCHKAIRDELSGGKSITTNLLEERERNRSKNAED